MASCKEVKVSMGLLPSHALRTGVKGWSTESRSVHAGELANLGSVAIVREERTSEFLSA